MNLIPYIGQWDEQFSVKKIEKIQALSASVREFFRVFAEDGRTVIVSVDPQLTPSAVETLRDKADFLYHNGLMTPRIFYSNPTDGIIIWEDVGENPILDTIHKEKWDFNQFKDFTEKAVIPVWKRLWSAQPDKNWPYFGLSKYLFEWEFHGIRKAASRTPLLDENPPLLQELIEIIISYVEKLIESRIVPIHRDFQSSNIFYREQQIILVDFQDALNGHPLYDPVSYIFDSYTSFPFENRLAFLDELIERYHTLIDPLRSKQELKREGYFLIFQRKLHDAGAFIYSHEKTGNGQFLKYIKPGLDMVSASAAVLEEKKLVSFSEALRESFDD